MLLKLTLSESTPFRYNLIYLITVSLSSQIYPSKKKKKERKKERKIPFDIYMCMYDALKTIFFRPDPRPALS